MLDKNKHQHFPNIPFQVLSDIFKSISLLHNNQIYLEHDTTKNESTNDSSELTACSSLLLHTEKTRKLSS